MLGNAKKFALSLVALAALAGVLSVPVSAATPYEIQNFVARGINEDGTPSTVAGGRPHELINNFRVSLQNGSPPNVPFPAGNLKDVILQLPPGIIGDAAAFPHCTQEEMDALPTDCKNNAQIGAAALKLRWGSVGPTGQQTWNRPVYNMVPPPGVAAQFAFRTLIATVHIDFHVRTGSDYGVEAVIHNSNSTAPVMASAVTIFGVPGDPSNDHLRIEGASNNTGESVVPYPEPPPFIPLLSNPTSCDLSLVTTMESSSWEEPGHFVSAAASTAPPMSGCNEVEFTPTIESKPTTNRGDSPSGLEFHLHVPQTDSVAGETAKNEVQSLRVFANRGQFKLSFNGQTTPDLPFNASAGAVGGALEALSSIGPGNIIVGGGPGNKTGSTPYKITYVGALGRADVEELAPEDGTEPLEIFTQSGTGPGSIEAATNTPGSAGFAVPQTHEATLRDSTVVLPPTLTVNPSSANGRGSCDLTQIGYTGRSSEKQSLTYDAHTTGNFEVSFEGQTTAPIPGEANQAEVKAALETLPGLAGNLSLEGAPGGWVVAFGGSLAGTDVPQMTATANANHSQTVAVTGTGGGFNLLSGGESTGGTIEASFAAGDEFFFYTDSSGPPGGGEPVEGPGLAPGTVITFAAGFPGGVAGINKAATSAQTNVTLRTALPFNVGAQTLQEALQRTPSLDGNAFVSAAGTVGDTRSYTVTFGGDLAGTEPALLSATSSLIGAGAGVVVTQDPLGPSLPVEVATTQHAGTPQFTRDPAHCPDNSKLGTVRIDSPAVIDHPLQGNIYLATPHQNPFNSLLAMYIGVDDPTTGVVVKLPGLIEADPKTGQLTAKVPEAPQLPFEDLQLEFFKGAGAPLKTGIVCGTSATQTDMVPWTSPEGATQHPGDSFTIDQGCAASEAQAPNAPKLEAGTEDPVAGAYSPFTLKLTRADGTQQLTGIDTKLPKGLIAKLAGIPYCSDAALAAAAGKAGKAEQASPSCPAASKVGAVTVGAGAGPTPYFAQGLAYLAGPYKGAPLSLAVVTPAVAGPFDLGTVVVRNALYVDPATTEVHAVSDPFPSILQGIPLDIRSIVLSLDRSQFTKNPTSCNPLAITGAATALSGQSMPLNQRFQVGDCGKLGFKPALSLSLKGQTNRTGNPALTAVLTNPAGQANLARAAVLLPATEFIDNQHINNPCTRVQFDANACPAKSVLGHAVVTTPLLDKPLEGPVYFRSNGGERELPDMVLALDGQIKVNVVGFIDSVGKKGSETRRVRTRFQSIPDAPFSKFVLKLNGGKRGLIENSVNICSHPGVATAQLDAQNGKTRDFDTPFAASCGKKKRK